MCHISVVYGPNINTCVVSIIIYVKYGSIELHADNWVAIFIQISFCCFIVIKPFLSAVFSPLNFYPLFPSKSILVGILLF